MATRYNLQLATPYVSAYNPANTQRFSDLMQQEYQKAASAKAALNQFGAQVGDIPTQDIEGRDQRLSEFDEQVNKIKDIYNNDLALAAPDLATAIMKERQNPWYQKNRKYMEQSQRRQELLDKFGPNILFVNDLPQGNLNQMSMDDINFEYLNRLHLDQRLKEQYGKLAEKRTDLEVTQDKYGMLKYGYRKGLTPKERQELIADATQNYLPGLLKDLGFENNPQAASMVANELGDWVEGNLYDQYDYTRVKNPMAGSGSDSWIGKVPDKFTAIDTDNYTPSEQSGDVIGNMLKADDTAQGITYRQEANRVLPEVTPEQQKVLDRVQENLYGQDDLDQIMRFFPQAANLSEEEQTNLLNDLDIEMHDWAMTSALNRRVANEKRRIFKVLEDYGVTPRGIFKGRLLHNDKAVEPLTEKWYNYKDIIRKSYKDDVVKPLSNSVPAISQQVLIGADPDDQRKFEQMTENTFSGRQAETLVYYDPDKGIRAGSHRGDTKEGRKQAEKLNQIFNQGDYKVSLKAGGENVPVIFTVTGPTEKDGEEETVEFVAGDEQRQKNIFTNMAIEMQSPALLHSYYSNKWHDELEGTADGITLDKFLESEGINPDSLIKSEQGRSVLRNAPKIQSFGGGKNKKYGFINPIDGKPIYFNNLMQTVDIYRKIMFQVLGLPIESPTRQVGQGVKGDISTTKQRQSYFNSLQ